MERVNYLHIARTCKSLLSTVVAVATGHEIYYIYITHSQTCTNITVMLLKNVAISCVFKS
jgi:hypothetical protein